MTYETITVGAGDTFRRTLGNGDELTDVLIDVDAPGAAVDISAHGSNWTIRNVGIRGEDAGADEVFMIGCSVSAGSTGTIENVYMGDGDEGSSHTDGEAAIYVSPSHAGTLELDNVYIANHTDNGLYGSGPGHEGRGGGEIHVRNSYSANNTASNIRLGTDGSFIENTCIWGGPHRGFWGYFEHTEIRDSHVGGGLGDRAVEAGEPAWDKAAHAEITVIDSEIEGTNERESTNEIHLDNTGFSPQEFVPTGCPTTPEEAASGGGTDEEPPEPRTEPEGYYETFPDGPDALDRYEGSASGYSIVDSNTLVSGHALQPSAGHARIITPEEGPERGSRFGISCYPSADDVGQFMFHFAAERDGDDFRRYAIKIDHDNGVISFGRFGPGGSGWINETPFDTTGTGGQWNDLLVDYGESDTDEISYQYVERDE